MPLKQYKGNITFNCPNNIYVIYQMQHWILNISEKFLKDCVGNEKFNYG